VHRNLKIQTKSIRIIPASCLPVTKCSTTSFKLCDEKLEPSNTCRL